MLSQPGDVRVNPTQTVNPYVNFDYLAKGLLPVNAFSLYILDDKYFFNETERNGRKKTGSASTSTKKSRTRINDISAIHMRTLT
ncbi:hypothetical protein TMatcc_008730 [Talaromyces marneffei ATCC 18224]|nr:hypothetical protein EYB25_006910 [Talaromyces marneffei]